MNKKANKKFKIIELNHDGLSKKTYFKQLS